MRFLFLVQGEGRGHMTQAISLFKLLTGAGHEVASVLIGKSPQRVIPDFFYQQIKCPVKTYSSPNFVVDGKQKGIRVFSSVLYNLKRFKTFRKELRFISDTIQELEPDVVINFYELMAGLCYMVYKPKAPMICIAHQYLIFHNRFTFPRGKYFSRFLLKSHTRVTSFGAKRMLALSFRSLTSIPEKRIYVVPPLLRPRVLEITPTNEEFILGYILNSGYAKEIADWHMGHQDIKIRFFWDKKEADEVTEVHDNFTLHKINDKTFLEYMGKCMGFSSTAGFESICEAMYLKKPILMIPTRGHFEQECNAVDAQKAGAGIVDDHFNLSRLLQFIHQYEPDHKSYTEWVQKANELFLRYLTSGFDPGLKI